MEGAEKWNKNGNETLTGYPSIDMPWLKYYKEGVVEQTLEKNTIFEFVYERNRNNLTDKAIKFFDNDIRYKDLFDNVTACTKALLFHGVKSGDCVNILSAGIPEVIYLVLACSRVGAVANFINPLFESGQMIDRINDTSSDIIFILDSMYSYASMALPKTCSKKVVIIPVRESFPAGLKLMAGIKDETKKIMKSEQAGLEFTTWKEYILEGAKYQGVLSGDYKDETPVVMVYSSGSTGASKGILHTNDSINATLQDSLSSGLYIDRNMTFLQMIPVWFSTGIVQSILLPLSLGIEVILEPRFDPEVFVVDMMKYRPVFTLVATSIWMAAIKNARFQKADLSDMLYPFTGGEKLIPSSENELNQFLKEHKCPSSVIKGYGMCELGGKVTDSIVADKPGSVGIPMAHIVVGIFDPVTNKELPYGEHGEVRVKSPAHMKEYYKNKKATEAYFWEDTDESLWGCTGDIGYVDNDGLLYVLGRATDSCESDAGKKIYLFDIEEEIIKDETVNQCKVVNIEENGITRLVAHVVFREETNDREMRLKKIAHSLSETLPEYMQPNYYKIRTSMPVHSNGKRDVETLRNDREGLVRV